MKSLQVICTRDSTKVLKASLCLLKTAKIVEHFGSSVKTIRLVTLIIKSRLPLRENMHRYFDEIFMQQAWFFCENVVGELDFSVYYLNWGEQAPRTSLWHLNSLSSVSKVTSKKSSSFLKSWNAVDKFDVKSFHFKQYFSPSTEPIVAVTILFNSIHTTFYFQSFILKKFFFSQLDLLLALSDLMIVSHARGLDWTKASSKVGNSSWPVSIHGRSLLGFY